MRNPLGTVLPEGACDCHMHIYDSRFPAAPGARLAPPDASVQDYERVQARLGLQSTVVVTPSTYGTDNRCTLEAVARLGAKARGIAVVSGSVTGQALRELHECGVRGIRLNQTLSNATSLDDLEALAERIAPLGWHVEMLLRAADLAHLEGRLRGLPVPVVFDHMGRLPAPAREQPGFRVLQRLLDGGNAWVKLSGSYLCGDPEDARDLLEYFVAAWSERSVWGSNWPHPTSSAGLHPRPDDGRLLGDLLAVVRRPSMLERLFIVNPAMLYGFPRH